MKIKLIITLAAISFQLFSWAQTVNVANIQKERQVHISRTNDKMIIDGELNEPYWQQARPADNFFNKSPTDIGHTKVRTEVRFAFDDNFMYIGAIMNDVQEYIVQSLKRDQGIFNNDGIGIVIDPINQHTNGFYFSVNPYNAQSDDQISSSAGGSGERQSFSWDNKWYSSTKRHADKWIAEIAIPFKTLRYDPTITTWGVNFIRNDKKRNEFHSWTNVPLNFRGHDIGFTGALIWDQPAPRAGGNVSVIPFITQSLIEDKEDGEPMVGDFSAGFDAKIALTTQLNLDLTVNPDFSQVDVDRQVTNLTRFSIFFPERRNFFLENADLFAEYGIPPIRPFYSRRIGLDNDGNTVPIKAGARISGNITNKTRIGIMNMQTAKQDDFAAQNYSAVSVQQRVMSRSSIKTYFFNRQASLNEQQKTIDPLSQFGRNAGLELSFSDENGNWRGWYGHHMSFKPGIKDDNYYLNGGASYSGRLFSTVFNFDLVGTNYYADMGFVQRIRNHDADRDTTIRVGYKSIDNRTEYRIVPKTGTINSHRFSLQNNIIWNPNGSFNERSNEFSYNLSFQNTSSIRAELNNQQSNLLFPVKFVDDDNAASLPVAKYKYSQVGFEYQTDNRKNISVEIGGTWGGFYNGNLYRYRAELNMRKQPVLNFAMQFEYNKLQFPGNYGEDKLFLIAPRLEVFFTTNLFWTTFFQFNTQNNNVNINSRFQWRYKPMSDIFLVFTDNYFSDPFLKNRNRAIVFKMNYWLNL